MRQNLLGILIMVGLFTLGAIGHNKQWLGFEEGQTENLLYYSPLIVTVVGYIIWYILGSKQKK